MRLVTVFWGFTTNSQWNMKWGLFVLTDMPVVTLSWLGPAVKTSLQNIRGRLFPGTCALWPLTPTPPLYPPITAVEVFVLGDDNGPTRLFCVTASTAAEREVLVFKRRHMTRVYPPGSTRVWTSGLHIVRVQVLACSFASSVYTLHVVQ